jgi:hypothetical protein
LECATPSAGLKRRVHTEVRAGWSVRWLRARLTRAVVPALALCVLCAGRSLAVPWQEFKAPPYCWTLAKGFTAVRDSSRVAVLPVLVNIDPPWKREGARAALEDFRLAEQGLLDSCGWVQPIPLDVPGRGKPPLVYFGIPEGECDCPIWPFWTGPPPPSPYGAQAVAARDGSREWRQAIGEAMAESDADYSVLLTVRVARLRPRGGIQKEKVLLGTGHTVPLESPKGFFGSDSVDVLVLCGALLDSTGRIVRAAAEGVCCSTEDDARQFHDWSRDRPPWFRLLQNRRMLTARRTDLPGQPLAYVVATRNLLSQLLGRPGLTVP